VAKIVEAKINEINLLNCLIPPFSIVDFTQFIE